MARLQIDLQRDEPVERLRFRVTWRGEYLAGVRRVSGLIRTTEVITLRDGADPLPRASPGRTSLPPFTIDFGPASNPAFEAWAQDVAGLGSQALREQIIIEIVDESGATAMAYKVHRCWVCEYSAFPAASDAVEPGAVQRLAIAHEGWERTCPPGPAE